MKNNKSKFLLIGFITILSISSFVYVNYSFYHNNDNAENITKVDDANNDEQPGTADFETQLVKLSLGKIIEFIFY